MGPGIARARTWALLILGLVLTGTSSGAAQQRTYYRVAPKIYVPFDPNSVKVLHQSERLFVVEIPHPAYASHPRISPFGDQIVFVAALSTFAFTSIYLDGIKTLRVPQDVPGAPQELKEVRSSFSFDRQLRTLAFLCELKSTSPNQAATTEVCVMRSDGTGLRRLTRALRKDESVHNHADAPVMSEDGSFVVYRRQYAGYLGFVRTDGTGLRVLVHRADGLTPVVLTRRAVFYTRGGQIWRAGLDGRGARQLTRERGEIRAVSADLDGKKMAYVARESGQASVLKVVDGRSGAVLLRMEGVTEKGRDWGEQALRLSGDGRRLLFSGLYRGKRGIYIVDLQTKGVFEVSAGLQAGKSADVNETGEIVVMTKEENRPLALAFLPDETPPSLWVDAPRQGATFRGEGVSVAIRFQDRAVVSGVDPQTVKILVNGRDVSDRLELGPGQARGQLTKDLLKEGENVLEVRVRDRAGNETRQVVRFQFQPKR